MGFVSDLNGRAPGETGKDLPVIALAGNPNVGKSTLFNALTGSRQHTGNWPGKTVTTAWGRCVFAGKEYKFVDLPGTYSLMAHSAEEEVARDFICCGGADAVVVVCDATCLERNLNLVLQTIEITPRVLVCVNLMDEAKRKGIGVDLKELERRLGVPVVGTSAGRGRGLDGLMQKLALLTECGSPSRPQAVFYPAPVEEAVNLVESVLQARLEEAACSRYLALRLLEGGLPAGFSDFLALDPETDPEIQESVASARRLLEAMGMTGESLTDAIVSGLIRTAEETAHAVVTSRMTETSLRDRRLDQLFLSRATGIPIMLLLLALILWITISGANYPSQLLARGLFYVQGQLEAWFLSIGAPDWLRGMLISGTFRVLCWVVSVMLPPMAIFFPLFTLLEQFGYLPRVAFNLDHAFQKAKTCGKQCLTMCMGFGCNAVGVSGCRIIDSPRERLIAMLTNNFVPCNGRFPPPRDGKQMNRFRRFHPPWMITFFASFFP